MVKRTPAGVFEVAAPVAGTAEAAGGTVVAGEADWGLEAEEVEVGVDDDCV